MVKEGKIKPGTLRMLRRWEAAHANAVDNFPLFFGSVVCFSLPCGSNLYSGVDWCWWWVFLKLLALHAGVPVEKINGFAALYTLARCAYAVAYINIETHALSFTRSVLWWVGNVSCFTLIKMAGSRLWYIAVSSMLGCGQGKMVTPRRLLGYLFARPWKIVLLEPRNPRSQNHVAYQLNFGNVKLVPHSPIIIIIDTLVRLDSSFGSPDNTYDRHCLLGSSNVSRPQSYVVWIPSSFERQPRLVSTSCTTAWHLSATSIYSSARCLIQD